MFIHRNCGSRILLDASSCISLMMPINLTKDGVFPVQGILRMKSDEEIKYFCPNCKKETPLEEIVVQCMECGDLFPLRNIFRLNRSSGSYCSECCTNYFSDESKVSLHALAKKIIFEER